MSITENRFAIAEGHATLFFLGSDSGMWQVWLDHQMDFDGVLIGHGPTREAALQDAVDVLLEGVRALRAISTGTAAATNNGGP